MKIDFLCNDGSPIGVTPADIYGRGVGGAELALMTLAETFAGRNHEVTIYNDPKSPGRFEDVIYAPKSQYNQRSRRDALIVFRSPSPLLPGSTAGRKIWWSTDQYTVGSFSALSAIVDFCVTISPYHTNYHVKTYGVDPKKIGHIDLGVRISDYEEAIPKIKNRLIYCSIPDRGLMILHAAFPLIQREIPDVSLVITSDYTLWGVDARDMKHRLNWAGMKAVQYVGNVNRRDLVKRQLEAEIMAYPCTYEELFCLSAAECQVAGALPVTTPVGALETTNQFGIKVSGDLHNPMMLQSQFVDRIVSLLTGERDYMEKKAVAMRAASKLRFDWNVIAARWESLISDGRLPR